MTREEARLMHEYIDQMTDGTPDRPEVWTWFLLAGASGPWGPWRATKKGAVSLTSDGSPVSYRWEIFDGHVADGEWRWKPLELGDE